MKHSRMVGKGTITISAETKENALQISNIIKNNPLLISRANSIKIYDFMFDGENSVSANISLEGWGGSLLQTANFVKYYDFKNCEGFDSLQNANFEIELDYMEFNAKEQDLRRIVQCLNANQNFASSEFKIIEMTKAPITLYVLEKHDIDTSDLIATIDKISDKLENMEVDWETALYETPWEEYSTAMYEIYYKSLRESQSAEISA